MSNDDILELRERLEQAEKLILDALRMLAELGSEEALLDSHGHRASYQAALEQLRLGQEKLEHLGKVLRAEHYSSTTRH